jgi:diacylglycerol kinase family enzyme
MPRPGVLVNARARRVRRDPALLEHLRELLPDGYVRASESPEEIAPAFDALCERDIDTLVLVGGDGTVGGTLTPLLACRPAEQIPPLALAPGGTINTIARSLGAQERPERLVRRLLEGRTPRVETKRPLVRVRPADGEARAGMIVANGVAVRWLQLYYQRPSPSLGSAVSSVARVVGSASVRGPLAHDLFSPAGVAIEVDGEHLELERFTVMAAANVKHIGLGFRPFHSAGRDLERFHFAVTEASAARLCVELPTLRLGLDAWPSCVHHYPARRVSLRFAEAQPWSVDADLFPPTRALELSATPPLRFVVP